MNNKILINGIKYDILNNSKLNEPVDTSGFDNYEKIINVVLTPKLTAKEKREMKALLEPKIKKDKKTAVVRNDKGKPRAQYKERKDKGQLRNFKRAQYKERKDKGKPRAQYGGKATKDKDEAIEARKIYMRNYMKAYQKQRRALIKLNSMKKLEDQ